MSLVVECSCKIYSMIQFYLCKLYSSLMQAVWLISHFLHRFDSRIIAAPAIVYRGVEGEDGVSSPTLVAGHSLEINATSDIDLHISLPQICLLQDIVEDTTRWVTHKIMHLWNFSIMQVSLSIMCIWWFRRVKVLKLVNGIVSWISCLCAGKLCLQTLR